MQVVHTIADLRAALAPFNSPALVPTMGNLHDGHLALVRQARALGDVTLASVFVNRLQFAPHEDFDTYPRTLEADCDKLRSVGCDIVFAPSEKEMYPEPQGYKVMPPPELANILEGHFRPGFFTGVCTVVMKLFQCVFATCKGQGHAVFGRKDYQQLMVVTAMARQFALPITIHAGETRRAEDGLALSSRNGYLSAVERAEAVHLSRALRALADQALAGGDLPILEAAAVQALDARGWKTDYLTVRRRHDLQAPTPADRQPGQLVALGASRLGSTRLIDNLEF